MIMGKIIVLSEQRGVIFVFCGITSPCSVSKIRLFAANHAAVFRFRKRDRRGRLFTSQKHEDASSFRAYDERARESVENSTTAGGHVDKNVRVFSRIGYFSFFSKSLG